MDELIYQSLTKYFNSLGVMGTITEVDTNKMLVLTFIHKLLHSSYKNYISKEDYLIIQNALNCVVGKSCLIEIPKQEDKLVATQLLHINPADIEVKLKISRMNGGPKPIAINNYPGTWTIEGEYGQFILITVTPLDDNYKSALGGFTFGTLHGSQVIQLQIKKDKQIILHLNSDVEGITVLANDNPIDTTNNYIGVIGDLVDIKIKRGDDLLKQLYLPLLKDTIFAVNINDLCISLTTVN